MTMTKLRTPTSNLNLDLDLFDSVPLLDSDPDWCDEATYLELCALAESIASTHTTGHPGGSGRCGHPHAE